MHGNYNEVPMFGCDILSSSVIIISFLYKKNVNPVFYVGQRASIHYLCVVFE